LVYTQSTYAIIFGLVCGIWIISELLGPVRWSGLRKGKQQDRPFLFGITVIGGLLGMGLCFLFPLLLPTAQIPWPQGIFFGGLGIALVGIGWRWYAIRTLGHYFTAVLMTHVDQHVIQHGPYRLVRHPSYSGVLLAMIGIGCMLGNWVSLFVMTVGLSLLVLYRIPREEQALLQHLGPDYQRYMERTKRLIPFLL
jgi:protein-S-isoprenylcysteine O-methyltransferase Ste14